MSRPKQRDLRQRARAPRLRTVLLVVHLLILCLPLAGIFYFRLYESQLVRQTESELIVQGAALAAAYRTELRRSFEDVQEGGTYLQEDYGRPVEPHGTVSKRYEVPDDPKDDFDPAIPGLDLARHPVLPEDPPGRPPSSPPDPLAAAAGARLLVQLEELQRVSLAGIRILDPDGVVVASTGTEAGLSLAHRPEVAAALAGRNSSVLRHREVSNPRAPLNDIQRSTGWRVVVAFPIESGPVESGSVASGQKRVWGVVLLARTPMSTAQALWRDRGHLVAAGILILGVVSLVTLWSAAKVGRPVHQLIEQAERVARGERGAAMPLERPGTYEVARISEAVARMAAALEERADYISTFAANVSHEFKTPLTSIRGAVELLEEHQDEMSAEERERFLAMLNRDARRLERLVDRLLELARADVHRPGDETATVGECLARLGRRFESLQVDAGDAKGAAVSMATETLDSVLGNLVDNAIRHTDETAGRVELRALFESSAAGDDGRVRFEVEDDGRGISEANLPRVFDRFFTTRRDDGGSGLGLSIVQALVVAHGGEVGVESEPGRTVFRVVLPARPASAG